MLKILKEDTNILSLPDENIALIAYFLPFVDFNHLSQVNKQVYKILRTMKHYQDHEIMQLKPAIEFFRTNKRRTENLGFFKAHLEQENYLIDDSILEDYIINLAKSAVYSEDNKNTRNARDVIQAIDDFKENTEKHSCLVHHHSVGAFSISIMLFTAACGLGLGIWYATTPLPNHDSWGGGTEWLMERLLPGTGLALLSACSFAATAFTLNRCIQTIFQTESAEAQRLLIQDISDYQTLNVNDVVVDIGTDSESDEENSNAHRVVKTLNF